jgi:hypothetical protein
VGAGVLYEANGTREQARAVAGTMDRIGQMAEPRFADHAEVIHNEKLAGLEAKYEELRRKFDSLGGAQPADIGTAQLDNGEVHLGNITITNRTARADVMRQFDALREGKIPVGEAQRFRVDARLKLDGKSETAKKWAGQSVPLKTEVTRDDFTPESLEHHYKSGALIPIG